MTIGNVGDTEPMGTTKGAEGRMPVMVLPQTAKQTIGMPSSPPLQPLQPLHPPGIGISLVEFAVDILTAMSDAWTPCAGPATTSARARNKPRRRRTFSDMAFKIAIAPAQSHRFVRPCGNLEICKFGRFDLAVADWSRDCER